MSFTVSVLENPILCVPGTDLRFAAGQVQTNGNISLLNVSEGVVVRDFYQCTTQQLHVLWVPEPHVLMQHQVALCKGIYDNMPHVVRMTVSSDPIRHFAIGSLEYELIMRASLGATTTTIHTADAFVDTHALLMTGAYRGAKKDILFGAVISK